MVILLTCSGQIFSIMGAKFFANAQAKVTTLVTIAMPYVLTSAAYYVNSQPPATISIKPSDIVFQNRPPEKKSNLAHDIDNLGIITCMVKNTKNDCGKLRYSINPDPKKQGQYLTYIEWIHIPREYRRQKVATQLLQEIETYSKSKNITRLELASINTGATACYKKFGFKKNPLLKMMKNVTCLKTYQTQNNDLN